MEAKLSTSCHLRRASGPAAQTGLFSGPAASSRHRRGSHCSAYLQESNCSLVAAFAGSHLAAPLARPSQCIAPLRGPAGRACRVGCKSLKRVDLLTENDSLILSQHWQRQHMLGSSGSNSGGGGGSGGNRAASTSGRPASTSSTTSTTSSDKDSRSTGSRLGGGGTQPPDPQQQPPPSPSPNGSGPGPGGSGGPSASAVQLRYWVLLLAEYGGVYGTAAVVLGALTHIDVFGGLRWDAGAVGVGLALMAPAMAFDALVGLPDWAALRRREDSGQLVRLFIDPAAVRGPAAGQGTPDGAANGTGTGETSGAQPSASEASRPTHLAATVPPAHSLPTAANPNSTHAASTTGSDGQAADAQSPPASSSPQASDPSPLWVATQRLRLALELMQESSVRNNPGARLTPLQELLVILVGCTADEMLYRAVLLTFFGRWLRDRAYEAGADDVLVLPDLGHVFGHVPAAGAGGGAWEVELGVVAQWASLAGGCLLGVAVFTARAWQEARAAQRLQLVEAEAAERAARGQRPVNERVARLQPGGPTAEELELQRQKQERLEAVRAALASSIGTQGALVWALEGGREVVQVAASGASFLLTGNLAAPLAGSILAQALVSLYQRIGLRRSIERRAATIAARRAAAASASAATAAAAAAAAHAASAARAEGTGGAAAEGGARAKAHGPSAQEAAGQESGVGAGGEETRVGTTAGAGGRDDEAGREGDGADSGGR